MRCYRKFLAEYFRPHLLTLTTKKRKILRSCNGLHRLPSSHTVLQQSALLTFPLASICPIWQILGIHLRPWLSFPFGAEACRNDPKSSSHGSDAAAACRVSVYSSAQSERYTQSEIQHQHWQSQEGINIPAMNLPQDKCEHMSPVRGLPTPRNAAGQWRRHS